MFPIEANNYCHKIHNRIKCIYVFFFFININRAKECNHSASETFKYMHKDTHSYSGQACGDHTNAVVLLTHILTLLILSHTQ